MKQPMRPAILVLFVTGCAAAQAQPQQSPLASADLVDLDGAVEKVTTNPGAGPAEMAVRDRDGRTWTVRLGSIAYLIAHDFNPKSGQKVAVRGYRIEERLLVAARVTMPDTGRSLTLRDADGRPAWRRQGRASGRATPAREKP